jgi:hypothetical protein
MQTYAETASALSPPLTMHTYEIRPRKDDRGVDLISDVLKSVGCGMTRQTMQSATLCTSAGHMML